MSRHYELVLNMVIANILLILRVLGRDFTLVLIKIKLIYIYNKFVNFVFDVIALVPNHLYYIIILIKVLLIFELSLAAVATLTLFLA